MESIYDWIGHASRKHHHKIRKLLEPLTLFCGVDRFWRNHHQMDGSYSLIGDYPPKAEIFFENGLFKGHPYFRHPRFFQSGFVIPGLYKNEEFEATQGDFTVKSGDCFHVFLAIQTYAKGFVEYGFATSRPIPGFEMVYLNHLDSFKKFILYFESEGKNIVQESLNHQIDIAKVIGDSYQVRPEIAGNILVPKNQLQFLASLDVNSDRVRGLQELSKREKEILGHYITGQCAKSIAKKLFISPRTVEKHIENGKMKLGITNKSALFDFLIPYKELLVDF